MRLRHICRAHYPSFPDEQQECSPSTSLYVEDSPTRLVTILYARVQADASLTIPRARSRWETDFGEALEDDDWQYCLLQL